MKSHWNTRQWAASVRAASARITRSFWRIRSPGELRNQGPPSIRFHRVLRGASQFCASNRAPKLSPLTPALSPVRGEGVASHGAGSRAKVQNGLRDAKTRECLSSESLKRLKGPKGRKGQKEAQ